MEWRNAVHLEMVHDFLSIDVTLRDVLPRWQRPQGGPSPQEGAGIGPNHSLGPAQRSEAAWHGEYTGNGGLRILRDGASTESQDFSV